MQSMHGVHQTMHDSTCEADHLNQHMLMMMMMMMMMMNHDYDDDNGYHSNSQWRLQKDTG